MAQHSNVGDQHEIHLTKHAERRQQQRGFTIHDLKLIQLIGTEVPDGYLLTEKDIKRALQRLRKLNQAYLVLGDDGVITCYRATARRTKSILRNARARNHHVR